MIRFEIVIDVDRAMALTDHNYRSVGDQIVESLGLTKARIVPSKRDNSPLAQILRLESEIRKIRNLQVVDTDDILCRLYDRLNDHLQEFLKHASSGVRRNAPPTKDTD